MTAQALRVDALNLKEARKRVAELEASPLVRETLRTMPYCVAEAKHIEPNMLV